MFSHPNDEDPSLTGKIAGTLAFHRVQLELDSKLADSARQNLSVTVGHLAASQVIGPLEQVVSGTELHARSEWRVEFMPELSATFGAWTSTGNSWAAVTTVPRPTSTRAIRVTTIRS